MIYNNIKHNKKKYIILISFAIVMNVSLFVCLKLENYNLNVVENIYKKYLSYVTIEKDPNYINSNIEYEDLSYEDYQNIGKNKYVKEVNYEQSLYFRINEDLNTEGAIETISHFINDYLTIIGNDNLESNSDFLIGNTKLIEGKEPLADYEVLISKNFAKEYSLEVGEHTIINYKNEIVRLKVVGIYDYNSSNDLKANTIYTTYNTTQLISRSRENVQAIYQLKSYENVDEFEENLYELGLSEAYYINNHKMLVEKQTLKYKNSIRIINSFKNTIFILSVIIVMIITSFIFNSKKEIIITYRVLGVSKAKLIISNVLELGSIIIISFTIAMLLSAVINYTVLVNYTMSMLYYIYLLFDIVTFNIVVLILINLETILYVNNNNILTNIAEGE